MTVCNLVQESPEFQRHDTMFVCMCTRKKWEGYRLSKAKVRCSYESVSEVARWGRLTRLLEQRVTFKKKKKAKFVFCCFVARGFCHTRLQTNEPTVWTCVTWDLLDDVAKSLAAEFGQSIAKAEDRVLQIWSKTCLKQASIVNETLSLNGIACIRIG